MQLLCFLTGSIEHPFLLSDNRHYVFYLWRKLLKPFRYYLIPLYAFCIQNMVQTIGIHIRLPNLTFSYGSSADLQSHILDRYHFDVGSVALNRVSIFPHPVFTLPLASCAANYKPTTTGTFGIFNIECSNLVHVSLSPIRMGTRTKC